MNPSIDRKSGASSKWVWIGSLGGFAGILVIVLIVVAMRMKPNDEQSVRQNEKPASEQQTDNEDPKDRNNPGNSNKGFSGSDKKPEKSVALKNKTDDTSATSKPKKNSRNKRQNTIPDPASKIDPLIFEPDLVTEIELPDWKIDEETALGQVVQSFMNSSGIDREKNEERLIRAGAPACPLIAAKIRAVENDRQKLFAVFPLSQVLAKMGPDAVPVLVDLVNDTKLEEKTRGNAIRALSEIGPYAESSIPDLIKIFHAQKYAKLGGLKMSVAGSFKKLGVVSSDGIAILREILENDNKAYSIPYVTVAIQSAEALGPKASELVPALRPYLLAQSVHSPDAAEALGAIGPAAGPAAEEFIKLIERDDKVVSYRRYHALRDIGPTAKKAVPALIDALQKSTHDFTRANIADALGRMGPAARDALPILTDYLAEAESKKPGQGHRVVYKLAIARIVGDQASAVPYLRQTLYDNTHNARSEAITQIGTLGKDAHSLVPDLARMILEMKTDSGPVRLSIHALGQLGPEGRDGLGALLQFINKVQRAPKGNKTNRLHAIDSIAQINSDARVLSGLRRIAHHDPNVKARDKARRWVMLLQANEK